MSARVKTDIRFAKFYVQFTCPVCGRRVHEQRAYKYGREIECCGEYAMRLPLIDRLAVAVLRRHQKRQIAEAICAHEQRRS